MAHVKQETKGYQIHKSYKYYYSLCTLNKLVFLLLFWSFCLFKAAPVAYGGSQARGVIRATAVSLRQSQSNARFEQHLRPTPQLTATPDP